MLSVPLHTLNKVNSKFQRMNLIDLNYLSFSIYFLLKEMKIYGFFIDSL